MSNISGVNKKTHYMWNRFCSPVLLNRFNVGKMADDFIDVFENITSYKDSISSLVYYPIDLNNAFAIGGTLSVGDKPTSIYAYEINKQYCYLTLTKDSIPFKYKSIHLFANYPPYLSAKIYLPYCGFVDIDVIEWQNFGYLNVRLYIDYLNNSATYIIGVSRDNIHYDGMRASYVDDENMKVIATHDCVIGVPIPLGSSNIGEIIRNFALTGVKLASNAAVILSGASTKTETTQSTSVKTTERSYNSSSNTKTSSTSRNRNIGESEVTNQSSTTTKPVNKISSLTEMASNSLSCLNYSYNSGYTDRPSNPVNYMPMIGKCILRIYNRKVSDGGLYSSYKRLYGVPINNAVLLSDCHGFTEISAIHFEGYEFEKITNKEKSLLEQTVAEGIILP